MSATTGGSGRRRRPRAVVWLAVLGLLVGLASLGLALLGLAARRVPPTTAWWLQLVALLLPVTGSAAGAVGLAWAAGALRTGWGGAWVLAALHLAVAGLVLWRVLGGAPPRADGSAPAFRVMSLNAAWSRRGEADEIGRRFAEAQPHVVALQEVSIRPGADEGEWVAQGAGLALLEDSTYTLTSLSTPSNPQGWLTNGTGLFARVPAERSDPVLLDTTSAKNAGRYTRTEVEWDRQPVAIYNVHFRSFAAPRPSVDAGLGAWVDALRASKQDFVAREAEARVLREALDAETLPFLVVGDFNATPDHWTYAHVAEGLADALDAAPGFAWTYPDRRPLVRIDAILASPEWSVRQASVRPPGVSDHRLVMADLELADLELAR